MNLPFDKFQYAYRPWQLTLEQTFHRKYDFLRYQEFMGLLEQAVSKDVAGFFVCIHSNYMDHFHIPMFDFDSDVLEENALYNHVLERLSIYHLEGALFKTEHGYHFIGNKLMGTGDYFKLLNGIECCKGFSCLSQKRDGAALRIGLKPNRASDIHFLQNIGKSETEKPIKEYFIMRDYLDLYMNEIYSLLSDREIILNK